MNKEIKRNFSKISFPNLDKVQSNSFENAFNYCLCIRNPLSSSTRLNPPISLNFLNFSENFLGEKK